MLATSTFRTMMATSFMKLGEFDPISNELHGVLHILY